MPIVQKNVTTPGLRNEAGSEFQTVGPATENSRVPNVLRMRRLLRNIQHEYMSINVHTWKNHIWKNAHRIAHNMTNTFPLRTVQCKPVCFYWRVCTMRRCSVVIADRTPVFNWRTFPMPDLWWIGLYDHFEGKVSAIGQPTRPTQPFILPGR